MKTFVKALAITLSIFLTAWVLASWWDIAADNSKPNPEHHPLNFFSVVFPSQEDKIEIVEIDEPWYVTCSAPVEPTEDYFDLTYLYNWCGRPVGNLRMIGAWFNESGELVDEAGNKWEWFGEKDNEALFLLWVDDMGTPEVEDDQIIKLWREVY